MAAPPPLNPDQILIELGHAREDERSEREERRGLETRASALLAAGAAVVGLVATAVQSLNVGGTDRDVLEIGIAVAGAVMVGAIALIVRVLNVRPTDPGPITGRHPGPHTEADIIDQATIAEEVRQGNLTRLRRLYVAARVFAVSVAAFVFTLVYAAFASSPPPQPTVTVVVHSIRGPRGLRGPAGPRGRQGPRGRPDSSRG